MKRPGLQEIFSKRSQIKRENDEDDDDDEDENEEENNKGLKFLQL